MSEMSEKNTFHIFPTASVFLVIYVKYVFQTHASILANAWVFYQKKKSCKCPFTKFRIFSTSMQQNVLFCS